MSNKKHHSETLITDEKTLMRRAWIDLAMDSVRSQRNFGSSIPKDTLAAGYDDAPINESAPSRKRRPQLYLAYSANKRTRFGS